MSRCDRLFVLWRDPLQSERRVVGQLSREAGGFAFRYADGISELPSKGFQMIAEFPEQGSVYRSPYLFPTFAQRVPSPKRPDYSAIMQGWGVEHRDDAFEVLMRSGGVQMTDHLELAEFREPDDDLTHPLEFRVAGVQFGAGADTVIIGESLALETEASNPHDPDATHILRLGAERIGYVPRQYSSLFARLLRAKRSIETIAVRRLTLPAPAGRLVVRSTSKTT